MKKKIHLTGTWIVKAPREEVYAIMSDFEKMPVHFPKVAESVRVIKKEGNDLTMEAQVKSFGRVFRVEMQTRLIPSVGYVSDNKSAIGSSGHEEFLMEEVPEGTKINYVYEVEMNNPFFAIFSKLLIETYAMRFWKKAVIDKLKEIVEK